MAKAIRPHWLELLHPCLRAGYVSEIEHYVDIFEHYCYWIGFCNEIEAYDFIDKLSHGYYMTFVGLIIA